MSGVEVVRWVLNTGDLMILAMTKILIGLQTEILVMLDQIRTSERVVQLNMFGENHQMTKS
jgi:hypothetical protein